MYGHCDKAENCDFAHTVAELEILHAPKYTSMNRKLIEMEGTSTVINSYLPTKVTLKMQVLSKRSYHVISPKVIFAMKIRRVYLSAPCKEILEI